MADRHLAQGCCLQVTVSCCTNWVAGNSSLALFPDVSEVFKFVVSLQLCVSHPTLWKMGMGESAERALSPLRGPLSIRKV